MFSTIVLTPEHCLDAGAAIAGVRAGERGVLDLGLANETARMSEETRRLARETGEWGVRWDIAGGESRGADRLASILRAPAPLRRRSPDSP